MHAVQVGLGMMSDPVQRGAFIETVDCRVLQARDTVNSLREHLRGARRCHSSCSATASQLPAATTGGCGGARWAQPCTARIWRP